MKKNRKLNQIPKRSTLSRYKKFQVGFQTFLKENEKIVCEGQHGLAIIFFISKMWENNALFLKSSFSVVIDISLIVQRNEGFFNIFEIQSNPTLKNGLFENMRQILTSKVFEPCT